MVTFFVLVLRVLRTAFGFIFFHISLLWRGVVVSGVRQ